MYRFVYFLSGEASQRTLDPGSHRSASSLSPKFLYSIEAGGNSAGKAAFFGVRLLTFDRLEKLPVFSVRRFFSKPDDSAEKVRPRMPSRK
jgi:hypothetical protein